MSAFQIVDALAASFFGLVGIWAAVVRRHWFLRFVVVGVFLLSTVLITAHEVAIEFGIQIALLMIGVWIARNRGDWQFKFSVETALLAMIVVAVTSAVIGNADHLSWWAWHFVISTGICTASYALAGLWLVFGQTRLRYRIPLTLVCIGLTLAVYHFAEGTRHAINESINGGDWGKRLARHYEIANVLEWFDRHSPSVLLGAAIVCSALLAASYSGWFTESSTNVRQPSRGATTLFARVGLIVVLSGVTFPLVYIFYRLMTPAEMPAVAILEPNGYDDMIAAGNMIDQSISQTLQARFDLSQSQLEQELAKLSAPLQQLAKAFKQPHFQVRQHADNAAQRRADEESFDRCTYALFLKANHAYRFGTVDQQVTCAFEMLHLSNALCSSWDVGWLEDTAVHELSALLAKLNVTQIRHITEELEAHDRKRQTLPDYLKRLQVRDTSRSWDRHLNTLLHTWSGNDPYKSARNQYLWQVANFRMLITQSAIHRYFLEQNRLPKKLTDLTPKYMAAMTTNPYNNQPMEYQNYWGGYALVCTTGDSQAPLIVTGPAAPYLWERLQNAWQESLDWLKSFSTATAPR